MEYLIGAVLGVVVGVFARLSGFDRDRAFYPTAMIVIASYYSLFAVMGASRGSTLGIEIAIGLVFCSFYVLTPFAGLCLGIAGVLLSAAYSLRQILLLVDDDRMTRPIRKIAAKLKFAASWGNAQ